MGTSVRTFWSMKILFLYLYTCNDFDFIQCSSCRYVVCEGYRDTDRVVYQYLIGVNDTLNDLHKNEPDRDVKEVVPLEMILEDAEFFQYVKSSNER